jgi:hypothetical protein
MELLHIPQRLKLQSKSKVISLAYKLAATCSQRANEKYTSKSTKKTSTVKTGFAMKLIRVAQTNIIKKQQVTRTKGIFNKTSNDIMKHVRKEAS